MSHGDGAGGQGDAGRKWQSPPGAGAQGRTVGVEKVVSWAEETRRYRRSPAGWWWLALFGVPLLFAVIGLAGAGIAVLAIAVTLLTIRSGRTGPTLLPAEQMP